MVGSALLPRYECMVGPETSDDQGPASKVQYFRAEGRLEASRQLPVAYNTLSNFLINNILVSRKRIITIDKVTH